MNSTGSRCIPVVKGGKQIDTSEEYVWCYHSDCSFSHLKNVFVQKVVLPENNLSEWFHIEIFVYIQFLQNLRFNKVTMELGQNYVRRKRNKTGRIHHAYGAISAGNVLRTELTPSLLLNHRELRSPFKENHGQPEKYLILDTLHCCLPVRASCVGVVSSWFTNRSLQPWNVIRGK